MTDTDGAYSRIPVLELPYPLVLHPGLVLSVPLKQQYTLSLLKAAMHERNSSSQGAPQSDSDAAVTPVANRPLMLACVPRGVNSSEGEMPEWGCVGRVIRLVNQPGSDTRLVLSGVGRARIEALVEPQPTRALPAHINIVRIKTYIDNASAPIADNAAASEMRTVARQLLDILTGEEYQANGARSAVAALPLLPPSFSRRFKSVLRAKDVAHGALADVAMGALGGACAWEDRVMHLSLTEPNARVTVTTRVLERGIQRARAMREVAAAVPSSMQGPNAEALIRAQIQSLLAQVAAIHPTMRVMINEQRGDSSPLVRRTISGPPAPPPNEQEAENDEDADEVSELAERIEKADLSEDARRISQRELKRLRRLPPQAMERSVIIHYLETLCEMPWGKTTADFPPNELSIPESLAADIPNEELVARAQRILDADHYGLEKLKRRLVEYLAVLQLRRSQVEAEQPKSDGGESSARSPAPVRYRAPILLLVGPPGTGKTSIARSLAAALRRPFVRVSLGGVRDEAEIRGHRRTYVGAMPGMIADGLRRAKTSDCVMLLDEVDKLSSGSGVHGDPSAAMLEVLDPEQNGAFKDHYIQVPIDLSRVLFVATANSLDTISAPLLDRTEVVDVAGYTYDEKVAIARRHLLPKQVREQGLKQEELSMADDVLLFVATNYTREAGVRTMERRIADIVRAKAVEYAARDGKYVSRVTSADVERILGPPMYESEVPDAQGVPGVSTGLAYQGSGIGGILHIETALLPPGNAELRHTGSLGEVISESAELAFAWVKSHAFALGITHTREEPFPQNDVHLHLPMGAVPKDGPSAGVALTCALVSLYLGVPLDPHVAITGEVTLRGHVSPVGGIKEKIVGAHRAGITKVVLPARNKKDYDADVPESVRKELKAVFVSTVLEALGAAFGVELEERISTLHGSLEGHRRLQELELPISRL
ncbi:endopeptidase La [Malassezia cuniculi]|uniref:Lon protease homolog n=1 Tax=Malassezia cuniculi TaxID=948313 RepID=A0AAF0EVC7_9BASI|nr:endopeptidase La [Malassezia cuniculi]